MRTRKLPLLYLLLAMLALVSWKVQSSRFIDFNNKRIAYMGRVGMEHPEAATFYWSGTSAKLNFEGTAVKALLKDETGDNYYNVILDQDSIMLLRPDTTLRYYDLAKNLPEGKHTIELFKRTEYDRGKTLFYGFLLGDKTKALSAPADKKKRIEFYGNSITAGYAVEDYSGQDSPDSTYTNNYLSYAALTARHYDADYTSINKSGIGILVSWFPYTMPEVYDRLDPTDPSSKWDFSSKKKPDVVVINLLQNDSWLVNRPEHAEFKRVFKGTPPSEKQIIDAYSGFVQSVRDKYPKAHIITMLGNMDITREGSPWPGYVQKAVDKLKDDKIYTLFVPYKNTPGHPNIEEQQVMADSLIQFIDANVDWDDKKAAKRIN
ncbi:lysophospholipase L1-like esterase [Pontibacter ummariensis]|uniref:Lysophospholipase L1 n=1 Tax=Pontibacter ummariensis TaxID=1610492 RepID=A0A239L580_9BACT|nr:SGNH/GDSL hydrolase family protein [Pontibacter ummariensis]PRY04268.1 lysophospholipase L1-like esterase [Pontibacter ummariensis]SNT25470.1 Lysophospholipase L1 [Pontibacter ummariensis]